MTERFPHDTFEAITLHCKFEMFLGCDQTETAWGGGSHPVGKKQKRRMAGFGIDMIEYGSDYLLGLAAFCPEKFALRDQYWLDGDERYAELNDALQYLGNVGFRAPVPAYKHSCAVFQHLIGRIPTSEPHAKCPRRPDWEAGIIEDCAKRLGYEL